MDSVFGAAIAFTVISACFLLFGHCFCALFRKKEGLIFQILVGTVLFLTIFSAIELPIEKLDLPFHVLVEVESLVFAVLIVACVVYCARTGAFRLPKKWDVQDAMWVLLLLIILQVVYGMNNGVRINGFDAAYYNGHAANALYTDTIYQYSARSGEYIVKELYMHDGYPMLIAFLAKIFLMHPLVMVNRVLASMEIVLMNLIVYEIAYRLSSGRRHIANWTVGLHAIMSIFCYKFEEGQGFYLWQRTAESKSMLANIYLPLAFLAIVILAKDVEQKYNWLILGVIAFTGVSLSISGIFVLCAMVGSGVLSILVCQRRWRYLIHAVLCMLPSMAAGIVRLLL